jgi:hypothetical protein
MCAPVGHGAAAHSLWTTAHNHVSVTSLHHFWHFNEWLLLCLQSRYCRSAGFLSPDTMDCTLLDTEFYFVTTTSAGTYVTFALACINHVSWHTQRTVYGTQLTKANTDHIHWITVSNFAVNGFDTALYRSLDAVLQTTHYIYGPSLRQPASLSVFLTTNFSLN